MHNDKRPREATIQKLWSLVPLTVNLYHEGIQRPMTKRRPMTIDQKKTADHSTVQPMATS